MSRTRSAASPARPLPLRRLSPAVRAAAGAPLVAGLGAGILLIASLLVGQALLGRVPFGGAGMLSDLWMAILHCVLLAYVSAAYLVVVRRAERVVRAVDRGGKGPATAIRLPPAGPVSAAWLAAGAAGMAFSLVGPYLSEPDVMGPLGFWDPRAWGPETAWHRVLGLGIGIGLGWFAYAIVHVSRRLARLAAGLERVDLFDAGSLQPFAQQGTTNALLIAVLVSLFSLFVLDLGLAPVLLALWAGTTVLTGVALLLPVAGARQRLRVAKRAELAWCDGEIGKERERLRTPTGRPPQGRLADLAAYRRMVADAPEWPFDSPALRRAILYLLIPLASWTAATLFQVVLERILFPG